MRRATEYRRGIGWFQCPSCHRSTVRPTWRVEASTEPPQVKALYKCQFCTEESRLLNFLNPGLLLFSVGIPIFVITFWAWAYFFPASFGLVHWLIFGAAFWIVALLIALLVQRIIYRFRPIREGDA